MRAWRMLVVSMVLVAAPAWAEDDVVGARKHFVDGVTRFQAGDFEGARASFMRAEAARHAPVTVYNIARAEERLGHPQAAVDAYERYLGEAGEGAEYTSASTLAIAQIKGRSARVRVETSPPGARVFVDGYPVEGVAPTTLLVTLGRHHVVVEGEGWRAERDVETGTSTGVETVSITRPVAPAASTASVAPPPPPVLERPVVERPAVPVAPPPAVPEELVYGVHFVFVPYDFLSRSRGTELERTRSTIGLAAGGVLEVGYALTEKAEIFARGLAAIGPEGLPFTSVWAGGVAFSYHVLPSLWLGGAFMGGRAFTNPDLPPRQRFDTDYVFAPSLELAVPVLSRRQGQWMFTASPSVLLASPQDNVAVYLPIGFGFRGF